MDQQVFVVGFLQVLQEAALGGQPGQGTTFLDGTKADGSHNHGLFATLAALTAAQASQVTVLGTSIAAHSAHSAYHMEVVVRFMQGDRGPFDWPNSFAPCSVDAASWQARQERLQKAYAGIVELANSTEHWDERSVAGIAGTLAHLVYHLGAIRQMLKLVR
jgi:hypothetical protein